MHRPHAERLTKTQQAGFAPNAAMIRGTEQEPIARAAYEAHTGVFVDQTGFVPHPTIKWLKLKNLLWVEWILIDLQEDHPLRLYVRRHKLVNQQRLLIYREQ